MNSIAKTTDERLHDLFVDLRRAPDGPPPTRKIAIISTPRCGSTLFCESLAETGLFGRPKEWLNIRYLNAYARLNRLDDLDLHRYLQFVVSKTTSPNGVFSINVHVEQYMYWKQQGFDLLSLQFNRALYLYRNDRLAQAFSLAKAWLTDQWSSESRAARAVDIGNISNSDILKALYHIAVQEEFYRSHLAARVDHEYRYEDYTARPEFLSEALEDCGVECGETPALSDRMHVQRGPQDSERLHELRVWMGLAE